ncbi:hypothetical protein D3C81_2072330 [compost metagenome]
MVVSVLWGGMKSEGLAFGVGAPDAPAFVPRPDGGDQDADDQGDHPGGLGNEGAGDQAERAQPEHQPTGQAV